MMRIAAILAVLAVLGCPTATSTPIAEVAGTWGGDNAGLIVNDTDVHVHIGCTLGDAVGPIRPDANGRFEANGTYNVDAYPVDRGIIHPARFTGQITGQTMTLTVSLTDTARVLGPVTLVYGKEPKMGPCPICRVPKGNGWRLLFDGKTFDGWRGLGYDSVPTAHWTIENGAIRKIPNGQVPRMADGQPAAGGDLMTKETFRDFELTWDWKISRAGNSGVKYNVSEELSMAAAPNHAALGFEYQMLDDSLHEDNKIPSHRAGALYDLIAPNASKTLKPVGEWNTSTIVFRGNHGEHWLNGSKVVEFDLGTPLLDSLLAKSKYRDIKGFAERRKGHIVLQDHGDEVFFRNIKIRVL